MHDLIISGGNLIDPAAAVSGPMDVAISEGRVARVGPASEMGPAARTIDASGKLVVPGLIDVHTHAFAGYHGALPDQVSLPRGTTTIVDAGSSGANAFELFKRVVVEGSRTRVKAWLNISTIGLVDIRVGELTQLLHVDVLAARRVVEENRDVILGIKIRISEYVAGSDFRPALAKAREVGESADVPIMVHIGSTNLPLRYALEVLRPGDVVTHMFTGWSNGIFDQAGQVLPEVRDARERGVIFDGAHGRRHLSFESIRRSLEQDFHPDTMSSDISYRAIDDTSYHLPMVISKLMAVGYSLEQVIPMVTSQPARLVMRDESLGTLAPGSCADVTILGPTDGPVSFRDSMGQLHDASFRLEPKYTIRGGQVMDATHV